MNADTKPDRFDWVTARSECSVKSVFATLQKMVEKNVESATALKQPGRTYKVLTPENGKFMVVCEVDMGGIKVGSSVIFELSDDEVKVMKRRAERSLGNHEPLFSAKPSLTVDGDCILEVEGELLKLWQVCRRALEPLFFES